VVLHGRELSVALRYGKMIRRVAEEPEPSRLLEEALGAPWAAFELSAPVARVTRSGEERMSGAKASVYELALAAGDKPKAAALRAGTRPAVGLRSWRKDATVQALSGRAVVDDATGALIRADLNVRFAAKGEGGPVAGTLEVHSELQEIAATQPITRPEQAQELAFRQRLIPEQRELLRGLPQAPAPEPPRQKPKTLPAGSIHPLLQKKPAP
jgi:hypothetical protein